MNICIHVLNVNNYFPELFDLTIKTIERYSKKIKANLNIITKRKYNDWPILTEKLQVYDYGIDYDWNLLLDADILIHPDTQNPFNNFNPIEIGTKDQYIASKQLKIDKFFIRDGRNVGLSGCVIAASRLTHDLFKFPLNDLSMNEILNNILTNRKIVDEYVMSRNLSKYGLKYRELFPIKDYNLLYHLGAYDNDKNRILDNANKWIKENW